MYCPSIQLLRADHQDNLDLSDFAKQVFDVDRVCYIVLCALRIQEPRAITVADADLFICEDLREGGLCIIGIADSSSVLIFLNLVH